MKLHYSQTSPYVRKVCVLALETGLNERLERVEQTPNPVGDAGGLYGANPLGKIPALELDDGQVLFDSRVICEYLDTLHDGPRWFPQGAERWDALRRQALADGILDAAVLTRYEMALRPEALRWTDWIEGQLGKIRRALAVLERDASEFTNRRDIGVITTACALGYLDFRYTDLDWRGDCPTMADWYAEFARRPAMQGTLPPAG